MPEKLDIGKLGTRVSYFPQSRLLVDTEGVIFQDGFFFPFYT